MKKYKTSRKERRKAEQNKLAYEQIKKGTTVLSSAIVVSSIAAPIAAPKLAEAAEDQSPSEQIRYSDNTTHTEVVQTQQTMTDPNNSMTQDTQTNVGESSSEEPSETQESSELSTSETTQSTEITESTTDSTETSDSESNETQDSEPADLAMRSAFAAQTRSVSPSAFIAEIAGHARSVATANDLYASVMMAQAILESDWGKSTLSAAPNHNLFGIKGSYQGQSVTMKTWEVYNGQWVQVNAAFRKYPSYSESFSDNAYVLRNTSFQAGVYYYSGAWKSNTNSYKDATAWLTGRYATDPSYNTKLNNIIAMYNLTQYDSPSSGGGNTGGNTGSGNAGGNTGGNTGGGTSSQDVTHTVKAGDSLWALASQYGVSIANIKSWNNLSSDVIFVGQKLVVKKGSGNAGGGNTGGNTGGSTGNTGNTGNSNATNSYYTVKSGDSLWAIANANGTSIANLRQWNNLNGDIIYPGQKLIVKKGSGNTSGGSTGGNTGGSTGNTGNTGNTNTSNSYYTVKSGDSLWAIASANGTSIANLRQWNNLNGDIIYPGQKLIVKKGSGNTSSGGGSSTGNTGNTGGSNTSNTAGASYTVKAGDSLWAIASANGTSVANLRQWNKLSGDIIYPGQKLIVKQGQSGSTSSSNASNNQGNSQTANTHTVKSGDTLWALSQKYGASIQKIKQLNGLSSDTIYIGQKLKVK